MKSIRSTFRFSFTFLCLACLPACNSGSNEEAVPEVSASTRPALAHAEDVVDVIHGTDVHDPYRWLEDWDDPDVKAYSKQQNTYARQSLNKMPVREAINKRLTEIFKQSGKVSYSGLTSAGDVVFALKFDPNQQQAVLVVLNLEADAKSERVLLDPNKIDDSGSTTIDWYEPSHDGSLIAVSMSVGGSEIGDLHVFNVSDGSELGDVSKRVNGGTAGGDVAWSADSSGYYYTRYPYPGELHEGEADFYQRVFYHKLGDDAANDRYVIGDDFGKIAEIRLMLDPTSSRLLIWVQDGDSSRFEFYLRQPGGKLQKISEFGDGHIQAAFGKNNDLYIISQQGAPNGRILVTSAVSPDLATADTIVAESEAAIGHSFYSHFSSKMIVAGDRIYLTYQVGGPSEIRAFSLDGKPAATPKQLAVSTPFNVVAGKGANIYFANTSYVSASTWYHFDANSGATNKLNISTEPRVDYSGARVVREFAKSKDGTMIPVNILLPKNFNRDGSAPALVTGYGGYGISVTPALSDSRHILFESGAVFAQANLRGGGEFGSEWHANGKLTKKQNVFDDFAAVIQHLIDAKYVADDRVAIVGGSNGGLLMGATMVQNPGLVSAVVSHVGIYDSIRFELDPNGAFNIPEFGTSADPDQFAALWRYSPYHNVKDGVSYPPVLLATGANDPRVAPLHSRKFSARLLAAQNNKGTVLLRTSSNTGHGGGAPVDETIELLTDQYAFIFHHLGVEMEAFSKK